MDTHVNCKSHGAALTLPTGLTIRTVQPTDAEATMRLLGEDVQVLLTGGMVCLAAEWNGTIVGMLAGWLGRPRGHVEYFHIDMAQPPRIRLVSVKWLSRVFEVLLNACGSYGWTAQTDESNTMMVQIQTKRGATVLPGRACLLVKDWR